MAGDSGALGDIGLEGGFGGEPAPLFRPDSGPGFSVPGRASCCSGAFSGRRGTSVGAGTSVCKAPTGYRLGVAVPADIIPA